MIDINPYRTKKKRVGYPIPALFFFLLISSLSLSCSILADRPVQLMSDTSAALKAAKEVSADSLAPEKYRLANEAYFRAKNEYRMKNFAIAKDYASRAKHLAEEAEYDALKQGSARTSLLPPEMPNSPPPPSDVVNPPGELATEVMKREAAQQQQPAQSPNTVIIMPGASPTPGSGAAP